MSSRSGVSLRAGSNEAPLRIGSEIDSGVARLIRRWLDGAVPEEDRLAWQAVSVVLVVLFCVEYLGFWSTLGWTQLGWIEDLKAGSRAQFAEKLWFSASRIVIYTVPPLLFVKYVMGKRAVDVGWRVIWDWSNLRIYVALYFAVLPFVIWASGQESFQQTYPFFKPEGYDPAWKWFVAWEFSYFLYFLAFEFFFRGFMLQALRPRFGTMAVAFMLIPYVMIHFRKPFAEALGAIIAGIILGVLAYRSRNAFHGALLHYAVAITMDLSTVEGL